MAASRDPRDVPSSADNQRLRLPDDGRVALLVDGDNLSPAFANDLMKNAKGLGRLDIRRVYAAEAGFRAWAVVPGFRAIRVSGEKNGTDLLLCIEAVEMACRDGVETFVLASDDQDFTHLAHWLRERGHHVLGLGTSKATGGWRMACSDFRILAGPSPKAPPKPSPTATPPAKPLSQNDEKIRALIKAEGSDGKLEIGKLGGRMGSQHSVKLATLGAATWRAYLGTRPDLYALDPKSATAQVRWIGPRD